MKQELLMQERVSFMQETALETVDIRLLKSESARQIKIFLPAYLGLMGIGLYILVKGPSSINTGKPLAYRIKITEDEVILFWKVAPYFSAFIFLASTIYFTSYYFRNIHPYFKDVRNKKKTLVFFRPIKTNMAFFNRYYLGTPLREKQQIEIAKEDFLLINDNGSLCLELGPNSCEILRLRYGEKEINFW